MENLLSVRENVLSIAKVTKSEEYCIKKRESVISSKIVINYNILIWFGEYSYLDLTINHSSGTRFVFIMAVLSDLTQLFGFSPAILTMSAMDIDNLDFIDPEVEAHMDEEQMGEEQDEITIRGARGGGRRGPDMEWRELDR